MEYMKGCYVLISKVEKRMLVEIGRLGALQFKKGFYAYVGSAMNSLEMRILRHLSAEKKFHWHIDYFLDKAKIEEVWYKEVGEECKVASVLSSCPSIKGFGCSDCACDSHLFYSSSYKKLVTLMKRSELKKYST